MKLGDYFTLEELTKTRTGLKNAPDRGQIEKLRLLVVKVLDPARKIIGERVDVNSGFRTPEVNEDVGGASTSQHLKAEAADIECSDNARLFRVIRDNLIFDQLIWEYGDDDQPDWVHVSYSDTRCRKQVLRAIKVGKKKKYITL